MGSAMRTPVTVIEFGTDKIRVLHGNGDGEGGVLVTAFYCTYNHLPLIQTLV